MHLEVETITKKLRPKVDPIDDVSFTGEFDEGGSLTCESSEEVSPTKKSSTSKPKKIIKMDKPHIVMNVASILSQF